ncbi:hypothetical protein H4S02_009165, partial [Coemansia sp. RSA 2611]
MAESRESLQRAEDDVLRRIAQFDSSTLSNSTPDPAATAGLWQNMPKIPAKLWTRSNATLVARIVMHLVKYPQRSAT